MRGRECVSPADFVFLSQITQISQIYLLRRVISPTNFTDGHRFFLCGNFFLVTATLQWGRCRLRLQLQFDFPLHACKRVKEC